MNNNILTGVVISSVLLATLFILPTTAAAQTNTDTGISGLLDQAQATLVNLATDVGLLDEDEEEDKENQDADVNVLTGRESKSPLLKSKQEQQADNEDDDTDGTVAGTSTQTNAELQVMLDNVQAEVDRLVGQVGLDDPTSSRPETNDATDENSNLATKQQLNDLKQLMYDNVESVVDDSSDHDDDTTYEAGSGLSLAGEDNTFAVKSGAGSYWSKTNSDVFYDAG